MKQLQRSSGILLPIASLPSPYGIGTLGQAAYDFIDFLAAAGQSWWQVLPVGPISYGNSPYQSFSSFAGNPYFVDLDLLIADGLLTKEEVEAVNWGTDPNCIDYGAIYQSRFDVLEKAANRGWSRDLEKVNEFEEKNRGWLGEYTLYMALKRHYGMRPWYDWEDEQLRMHDSRACAKYRVLLQKDIRLFTYIQYLFFDQWEKLRAYAKKKKIGIIGDLPIYVAMDSADIWSEPYWFQLDEKNVPTGVAGVPPDYFNENGQLWGNPLYNWDRMRDDGYGWWIRRIDGAFRLYDVLRFDHFRGLESYWKVPYGSKTAKIGEWVKGPGIHFVKAISGWFWDRNFIAEDLGLQTPEVKELLDESGFPGMKVLVFAFSTDEPSAYLLHNHTVNSICYSGTHDNSPLAAWRKEAKPEEIAWAKKYLVLNPVEGFNWGILRGGMSSVACLFVAQLQDYLELGPESRINFPGTEEGNWCWRASADMLSTKLAERIYELADRYGRVIKPPKPKKAEADGKTEAQPAAEKKSAAAETKE